MNLNTLLKIPNLKMIVATSKNGGIGLNGKMPWYIPSDMSFFKEKTIGNGNNAVIMGKNTWESLSTCTATKSVRRHLLQRDNLVLSKTCYLNEERGDDTIKSFLTPNDVRKFCIEKDYDETWIIGGTQIYELFMDSPELKEIYKTHINHEFKCDTFFPKIPDSFVEQDILGSNVHQTLFYWIEKYVQE